jgi:hypothetical protein
MGTSAAVGESLWLIIRGWIRWWCSLPMQQLIRGWIIFVRGWIILARGWIIFVRGWIIWARGWIILA